jgi:uncharacterized phage infection (PIP) family protein YhgE
MFKANVTPEVVQAAAGGIQKGIDGLNAGLAGMDKAASDLKTSLADIEAKQAALLKSISDLDAGKKGLQSGIDGLTQALAGMDAGLAKQKLALTIKKNPDLEAGILALEAERDAAAAQKTILEQKLADMGKAQDGMRAGAAGMDGARKGMEEGLLKMAASRSLLEQTVAKMTEIRDAIPGAFEASRISYLNTLETMRPELEGIFQKGLNGGFHDMYLMVSILAALAIAVLMFYNFRRRDVVSLPDLKTPAVDLPE